MWSLEIALNQAKCCSVVSDSICSPRSVTTFRSRKIGHHLYQTGWGILSSHKSPFFLNRYGLHSITLDITSITRNLHRHFHIPLQQCGHRNSLSWICNCSIHAYLTPTTDTDHSCHIKAIELTQPIVWVYITPHHATSY